MRAVAFQVCDVLFARPISHSWPWNSHQPCVVHRWHVLSHAVALSEAGYLAPVNESGQIVPYAYREPQDDADDDQDYFNTLWATCSDLDAGFYECNGHSSPCGVASHKDAGS